MNAPAPFRSFEEAAATHEAAGADHAWREAAYAFLAAAFSGAHPATLYRLARELHEVRLRRFLGERK